MRGAIPLLPQYAFMAWCPVKKFKAYTVDVGLRSIKWHNGHGKLRSVLQRLATGWTIGVLGFDSCQGLRIFLFTTVFRPTLGFTQPPIQWVSGVLSLGVKRPWPEADHSPISSAEFKKEWSYTSTPQIRLHGLVLS
jgi:hypothetical protein